MVEEFSKTLLTIVVVHMDCSLITANKMLKNNF